MKKKVLITIVCFNLFLFCGCINDDSDDEKKEYTKYAHKYSGVNVDFFYNSSIPLNEIKMFIINNNSTDFINEKSGEHTISFSLHSMKMANNDIFSRTNISIMSSRDFSFNRINFDFQTKNVYEEWFEDEEPNDEFNDKALTLYQQDKEYIQPYFDEIQNLFYNTFGIEPTDIVFSEPYEIYPITLDLK